MSASTNGSGPNKASRINEMIQEFEAQGKPASLWGLLQALGQRYPAEQWSRTTVHRCLKLYRLSHPSTAESTDATPRLASNDEGVPIETSLEHIRLVHECAAAVGGLNRLLGIANMLHHVGKA